MHSGALTENFVYQSALLLALYLKVILKLIW
jgi:hypothetical protein